MLRRSGRVRLWASAMIAVSSVAGAAPAHGQTPVDATVTRVSAGDTLVAETADGRTVAVRLIGIDAPSLRHCGGSGARNALRNVALSEEVRLVSDPALAPTDEFGRSWLYVERADGLDLGLAMVRAGWATVIERPAFGRQDDYWTVEAEAEGGVWRQCDGDFDLTLAEQRRALLREARSFVRLYYSRLSSKRFRSAWGMLGAPVRRQLGHSYNRWRSGYRRSLGVRVTAASARIAGGRPVVSVRLRSRDRDVCSGRAVAQRFRGTVRLAERGDSFVVVRFNIRKTAGQRPRLSKSECPRPKPQTPTRAPSVDCQGYDPCLPPGPDVDCAGGSGDGPRYVQGPVRVYGDDPYGLDRDGDGIGCES